MSLEVPVGNKIPHKHRENPHYIKTYKIKINEMLIEVIKHKKLRRKISQGDISKRTEIYIEEIVSEL